MFNLDKYYWSTYIPVSDLITFEKILNKKPMPKTSFTAGADIKKGERITITQGGYAVPIKEKTKEEIIKQCLLYCLHRKRSHPECGLSVRVEEIERVLDK